MKRTYTIEEDNYIKNNYGKIPTAIIANNLKRTEQAVRNRAKTLNVSFGSPTSLSPYGLTDKQEEILRLMCKGFEVKEIAEKLFIEECTVKTHINDIVDRIKSDNGLNIPKNSSLRKLNVILFAIGQWGFEFAYQKRQYNER